MAVRRAISALMASGLVVSLLLPCSAQSQPAAAAAQPAAAAETKPAAQPGAEAKPSAAAEAKPSAAAEAKPSAAATPKPAAAAGTAATGTSAALPKMRKGAPPPPPPTDQQKRALQLLLEEAEIYQRGAREFRDTLTMIVRHHYEQRRRRILSALDQELEIEKKELVAARDEAIRRLEEFVARYSGENAHPEATPDAMFRLAALYEERARADFEAELGPRLKPAIDLYRRIIAEYPQYEEIAGVHYFLGHAYTDAGRLEEGQQAWRALVCSNRFTVRPDPADPEKISVDPLPQDHDQKFWGEWYNKNPIPLDQVNVEGFARRVDPATALEEEELIFRDPYPAECQPLPQKVEPGKDPRYLPEVWWQIGNFHFDQVDPNGGPFNLNRAVSAYDHALQYKQPPLYGVSMYKQAWTYFKQQRYRMAVEEFVKLLYYTDEMEEKTGDPGADFRSEAYTYVAGSLTYADFEGPPAEHPFIPRSDVLDLETDPLVAEQKMTVAIERLQDPGLIPQDRKWTVEIYKSLAQEFIDITQNRNAITVLELTLEKFPLDRDAPRMQAKVAELYDQLSRLSPEGSAAREEYAAKALDARTKLAAYVGATPWTDANRDDPEALEAAEQLVRNGLKRAAADHTNFARSFYNKALELNDADEQKSLLRKSIAEYRLAETGWAAYLEQDPTALDSYETQFWLADALYWAVVLQVLISETPPQDEVARAVAAAATVRDSNQDDKYLQPAAFYVVSVYDKVLEDQYRLFNESAGAQGIEERKEVKFTGEGEQRQVVKEPLPALLVAANQARDAYNMRIALDRDPEQNGLLYAFQVADSHFLYGDFDEARRRLMPLYEQYCGKNEWGYQAWERLISMSNFQRDVEGSRKLAEGKSCAVDEETQAAEDSIRKPVKQGVAYLDARKVYEEAEKMPEGPERNKKWREAAAAYKVALDAAPDRDEAPEAAMNGAYAYKQVGEYDKAIEMYELFISRYGDAETLAKLRDGDPKAEPPAPAEPAKYEARTQYLKSAYDALAGAYVLFFNYPRAAETFDKISTAKHFKPADRREAASQALALYASLGDAGGMDRARQRMRDLGASPEELAEADYVVASAELKKWDQYSPNTGANAAARRRAARAMSEYYDKNRAKNSAAKFVVRAAYWTAKMHRAAKSGVTNKWWTNTIGAFKRYKVVAPRKDGKSSALGSPEASMAAEAEYTMLDANITKKFDYDTGHHHYKGTTVEVIKEYRADAGSAKTWHTKLQHVIDAYVSPEWTIAALSRQGSLYDSLRTGLYSAREPALKMFDAKTERALKRAEGSGNPELEEKADMIRMKVRAAWRDAREKELNSADEIMVTRYAQSIMLARRYNISTPAGVRAIRRLAYFTDVIGEAKMAQFAGSVKDLNYTPGMFMKSRPGLVTTPKPEGMPHPLPVLAQ